MILIWYVTIALDIFFFSFSLYPPHRPNFSPWWLLTPVTAEDNSVDLTNGSRLKITPWPLSAPESWLLYHKSGKWIISLNCEKVLRWFCLGWSNTFISSKSISLSDHYIFFGGWVVYSSLSYLHHIKYKYSLTYNSCWYNRSMGKWVITKNGLFRRSLMEL